MKRKWAILAVSALMICGCSVKQQDSSNLGAADEYIRDASAGSRTKITMEEAVQKKNAGEPFVLLYTKEDCSYCAAFDEVLNQYLPVHKLDLFEVSLTEAENTYSSEDREAMQDILSGGISKTPALYYIENPATVWMLDHSEYNYSFDGLDEWVAANQLDRKQK